MGAHSWQQTSRGSNPLQQPSQLGSLQQQSSLTGNVLQAGSLQQLIKSTDRSSVLTLSDDNVMENQIRETHAPDDRKVEIRPLLYLVKRMLNHATPNPDGLITKGTQAQNKSLEEKTDQAGFLDMLHSLSYTIYRISSEMSYKTLYGMDSHQTSLSILRTLAHYAWDAKMVMILAAFALHYGEFWLLAQIHSTNQLAKSMALLKKVPGIIDQHAGTLKPRFDALNNLIREILKVIHCVADFNELPPMYITPEVNALSSALKHIPTVVYWTVRSVVAITIFTRMGYDWSDMSTIDAGELSTLANKLKNFSDHLKKQLEMCYQHIEDKILDEISTVCDIDHNGSSARVNDGEDISYEEESVTINQPNDEPSKMLVKLFKMKHIDNMEVLKALIYTKNNLYPLVDGSTKKRVKIDVLRKKNVLLLISGLNISQDELYFLEHKWQSYQGARRGKMSLWLCPVQFIRHCVKTWLKSDQYEVVWIPVVERSRQWTDPKKKHFENLQSTMPWYTVHPSLIGKEVVKFMRKKWHFRNEPILAVLDPQGKVVSPNAIRLMWIWGSNAFPFTSSREQALWRKETWRLELLVDDIDPPILNWIKDGKYIFLYGGDDTEWIRKFTNSAQEAARAARIPLEMVYVGKGNRRKQVQRVIETITRENLSSCWQNLAMIRFFWTRLESMLFSKIQLGKFDDPVLKEIAKLLSYDREGSWAMLSKGSNVVVNGHGRKVLATLLEYNTWKENVSLEGFGLAFKNYHDMHGDEKQPSCRFELSHAAGSIPESMSCPQCHRVMKKYITFLCCHD